ncbi:catalase [Actinomycetospora soli]|uniref:catalase n=1 Tax=Actinomycetospora soli TaxID=2893887 RepID=UPI001E52043E|nr:catalase [Actinomycetospora soli]MCD2191074.1 catalase [Actinomycetospora soli]
MTSTGPTTTTVAGEPQPSDEHSLTQGPGGGILLHDRFLIEKMAHFNRERIPERVVHAKGAGAFGRFEVTDDVSAFTRADFLQPGRACDVLVRFSHVAIETGGGDTFRDLRGFAIKFYTDEGNYDLVGNNTPIFWIRDPMKFQDFIRSQKRTPDTGLRDNTMQWDFWTLSPESAHQVAWLFGDRGLPYSYRHMNGYGSHTFQWINAAGERFWIKYHLQTDQGVEHLSQDDGERLAGASPDYYTQDLSGAIAGGEFPSWTVYVQVMPVDEAAGYRFNPFDLTKVWPHEDYPLRRVGRMTLDRNPENYFAQIEQAAFAPSNLVPGIDVSPDKMLLGRMFSYADTHRYRLGVNYTQLPVNAPVAPVHSYAKDGAMRVDFPVPPQPTYAPNSFGGPVADPTVVTEATGLADPGDAVRAAYVAHAQDDDYGQAHTLVREVMSEEERDRLVDNVVGHLLNGVVEPVLSRVFAFMSAIDDEVGKRIEEGYRRQADDVAPTTGQSARPVGDVATKT